MLNVLPSKRFISLSAVVIAIAVAVLLTAPIAGQIQMGSFSGSVSDPTGAILPGVRIVVSSLQGGSEKRALSSDSGTFVVANLDPGRYVVEASFPGFASWVAKVVVEPGQRLDRNVVLALDGFALNVEVSSAAPVSPRQAAPSRSPLRVGGDVLRPALTQMTEPLYPPNARDAGISGTVLLHGVINTSGKVNDLRVLGNPNRDLAQAAMDAVSEWTYRPSMLNGVPVAVPATISVDFRLR